MAKRGVIRVATCQFAIGGSVRRNATRVAGQIDLAADQGADVVHFPEAALSGYAGTDLRSWDGFDWDALVEESERVRDAARARKVWVVVGSAHRLGRSRLPHNCLYAIDFRGRIVERYDKRFCTSGDLRHYTCGDHLSTFKVNGVTCGLLICYDVRFPELYREYKKLGVDVMFHSFYNARKSAANIHTSIMPTTVRARAATNYVWVSANNASGYYQSWSSFLARPDGEVVASAPRHRASVMVNTIDLSVEYYDAAGPFRERAMKGVLHSGRPARNARSQNRNAL